MNHLINPLLSHDDREDSSQGPTGRPKLQEPFCVYRNLFILCPYSKKRITV